MESSDGSNDDSTDGWTTVGSKKPSKKLPVANRTDDRYSHNTTGDMTGVTNVNKRSKR